MFFKMFSSDPGTIRSRLPTLQVVPVLVFRMDTFTHLTFSTVLLANGHPMHLASTTEVTWVWNFENCSELAVLGGGGSMFFF
jgi:hypothetical protein